MDQTAQTQIPQPQIPAPPFAQGFGGAQQAIGQAAQAATKLPPTPVTAYAPIGTPKEQMVAPTVSERVPLVELQEPEKIPQEVEGWMEKLEQAGEIRIPQAIKKDEQVILDNATPTRVKDTVVLPLSQQGAAVAAKKSVSDSARWLYEWCKRLMLILQDRAKYRV